MGQWLTLLNDFPEELAASSRHMTTGQEPVRFSIVRAWLPTLISNIWVSSSALLHDQNSDISTYLLCRPTYSLSPVHWPCINTDRRMTTLIMLYNEPQYCWRSDFQLLGYSFDEFTAHFPGFHTTTKINESFPRFSFILNRPRTRYI